MENKKKYLTYGLIGIIIVAIVVFSCVLTNRETSNTIDNGTVIQENNEEEKEVVKEIEKIEKTQTEDGYRVITTYKDGTTSNAIWSIIDQSTYTKEDAMKVMEVLIEGGYTEDNNTYYADGTLAVEGPKDAVLLLMNFEDNMANKVFD